MRLKPHHHQHFQVRKCALSWFTNDRLQLFNCRAGPVTNPSGKWFPFNIQNFTRKKKENEHKRRRRRKMMMTTQMEMIRKSLSFCVWTAECKNRSGWLINPRPHPSEDPSQGRPTAAKQKGRCTTSQHIPPTVWTYWVTIYAVVVVAEIYSFFFPSYMHYPKWMNGEAKVPKVFSFSLLFIFFLYFILFLLANILLFPFIRWAITPPFFLEIRFDSTVGIFFLSFFLLLYICIKCVCAVSPQLYKRCFTKRVGNTNLLGSLFGTGLFYFFFLCLFPSSSSSSALPSKIINHTQEWRESAS